MPNSQILRGAPAVISVTLSDQNGQPRIGGVTTVTVKRFDDTTILTNAATSNGATTGVKQVTLDASVTNQLDELSCVWQETAGQTIEQTVEVVGGYYFTISEARAAGPNLDDVVKYPDVLVIRARQAVEEWIESRKVTGRAFVPRFRTAKVSGNDRQVITLPDSDLRRVRSLGVRTPSGVFYADAIDNLRIDASGRLTTPLGLFVHGVHNVEVTYECGFDAPPERIKTAALFLLRETLKFTKTGAPDPATFQIIEGRVFGVSQPGSRGSRTGIPHVDEALDEWTFDRGSAASVPYG